MDKDRRKELLQAAQLMAEVWTLAVQILEEQLEADESEQPTEVDPKPSRGSGCRADYLPGPPVISQEGAIPRESEDRDPRMLTKEDMDAHDEMVTAYLASEPQPSDKPRKLNKDGTPRKVRRDKGVKLGPRKKSSTPIDEKEQLYQRWLELRMAKLNDQIILTQDVLKKDIFDRIGTSQITRSTTESVLRNAVALAEIICGG